MFSFIVNTNPHRYTDDNKLSKFAESHEQLLKDLTTDGNISIDWLTNNDMIANHSKF